MHVIATRSATSSGKSSGSPFLVRESISTVLQVSSVLSLASVLVAAIAEPCSSYDAASGTHGKWRFDDLLVGLCDAARSNVDC